MSYVQIAAAGRSTGRKDQQPRSFRAAPPGCRRCKTAERAWDQGQHPLQPKVPLTVGREIVFAAGTLAALRAEMGQRHPSGIFPEGSAAQARNAAGETMEGRLEVYLR